MCDLDFLLLFIGVLLENIDLLAIGEYSKIHILIFKCSFYC